MKTKTWVLLFCALALVLAACSVLLLFCRAPVQQVQVRSDGETVLTIDLTKNGEYRIEGSEGWNVLRVSGGKISVTDASCAGHDCMRHAPADSGAPIVCLPNRMVVRFVTTQYDTILQ